MLEWDISFHRPSYNKQMKVSEDKGLDSCLVPDRRKESPGHNIGLGIEVTH